MPESTYNYPRFCGTGRKNDALFMYGCNQPLPWCYCYTQETTEVVHGPSCKPENEVFLDRCIADTVPVLPRRGGGGTVVLSPGMIIIVVVGPRQATQEIREIFGSVHAALKSAVQVLTGLEPGEQGISDLTAGSKKICGSSLYLCREPMVYCYQSSLMINNDLTLLERYLKHPPREPQYRIGRPHGDFCTNTAACAVRATATEMAAPLQKLLSEGLLG